MLFFPAGVAAEAQCAAGGDTGETDCEEPEETALLQSRVTIDHADAGQEQTRALLTHREGRRRRKGGFSVKKTVKSVKKTASSAANSVAKAASQALSAAQNAVNSAVNAVKNPNTFKALLPSCLKGGNLNACNPIPSVSFLSKIDLALKNSMQSIANCFGLSGLTNLVKGMKCTKKITISYPSGVKFNWPPSVQTSKVSICTETSGLNMNSLKSMAKSAKTCGQNIYNQLVNSIGNLKPSLLETGEEHLQGRRRRKHHKKKNTHNHHPAQGHPVISKAIGCVCPTNFGIYFGAGGGAAYGVSAGLNVGFIMGCDGCNFQFDGFWGWSAGLVTNIAAADVAATLGYVTELDGFFGTGYSVSASAPVKGVVGAAVAVGLTEPELTINWSDKKISKKACVAGQCKSFSTTLKAPSGVKFVGPEFSSIDVSVNAGVSELPADVGAGYGAAYKLAI
jgi:hypothetical protein